MRNSELGRTGAVRPLWSEADSLRERVADAAALFGFFSFDAALSQRASHGHLRTNPAARAARPGFIPQSWAAFDQKSIHDTTPPCPLTFRAR